MDTENTAWKPFAWIYDDGTACFMNRMPAAYKTVCGVVTACLLRIGCPQ